MEGKVVYFAYEKSTVKFSVGKFFDLAHTLLRCYISGLLDIIY